MGMGKTQVIEIYAGSTYTWRLTVERDDEGLSDTPGRANLLGALVEWEIKRFDGDLDPLITKTSLLGGGILILDQTVDGDTEGQADLTLPAVDTWPAPPAPKSGNFRHHVKVTFSNGEVKYPIAPSDFILNGV